jgi:hypothetical protein
VPGFIKMGLGGTGFMGRKGKHASAARRRAQRRKVLEGFPITRAFESIDEVKEYLSGDKIICLLCGKSYKVLGVHLLKIHGVTVDEYRERYRIPWSYGVLCKKSHNVRRKVMAKRMAEGFNPGNRDLISVMNAAPQRECPYKKEIALKNRPEPKPRPQKPSKPKRPSKPKPTRFGSPEHREKMRQHGLKYAKESAYRLADYWRGRKQSDEHKAKRMAAQEAYLVRTGKKKPVHVHVESRPCRMCDKGVPQPAAGRKLYCSTYCRSQYYEKKKHTQEAVCSLCGHAFVATRSQARRMSRGLPIYCSLSCRQSANGRQKR